MAHKCTQEALLQVQSLRTSYPWAVANNEQIVIGVFNYRADAKAFEKLDAKNRVAYDASGVVFELHELSH